jgi:hypothetical protein
MIYVPISVGELIDKLSILHVKKIKIDNEKKLILINKEFELLYNLSSIYLDRPKIEDLYHQLCDVNEKLWNVEDKLRMLENEKSFEDDFIDLSRKVYITNDQRFILKNEINLITNSEIREVKEYVKYN